MLEGDTRADSVIVGAGIAGVSTAYHILRDTSHRVLLLEAGKVAHGATGHNAGQITTYFERPFSDLADSYGIEAASRAQAGVESGWTILETMRREATLATPIWRFTGYAACANKEQILLHLRDNLLRSQGGLLTERLYISATHLTIAEIPEEYREFCQFVPHAYILSLLETKDAHYIAAICYDKGCMNSALFTEEVTGYLLRTYPDRFTLAEETRVERILFTKDGAQLKTPIHTITADRVILCTNGSTDIAFASPHDDLADTYLQRTVEGKVGYMAGYLEPLDKPPTAASYFPKEGADPEDAYFYLTRRPYDISAEQTHNLLCIGGPDRPLKADETYDHDAPFGEDEFNDIESFLKKTYAYYTKKREEEFFLWHGLMGYTKDRLRLVGTDPHEPALLYNLGCNGVGILASLYGAQRIADLLAGKDVEPSLFEPKRLTG